jgi:hypothetical protein
LSPLWKTVDVNFDSIVVAIGFFFYHSRAWSGLRKWGYVLPSIICTLVLWNIKKVMANRNFQKLPPAPKSNLHPKQPAPWINRQPEQLHHVAVPTTFKVNVHVSHLLPCLSGKYFMQTTSVLFYCRQLSLVIVICRLCYLVLVSIAGGGKHVNHIDICCGLFKIQILYIQ